MTFYHNPAKNMMQLSIPGGLLSTNADQFRVTAHSMMEAGNLECQGVEVNLENAHMVDSAGLNALIGLLRKLKNDSRRMVIRVADPHVHRVLLFTHMDKQAEILQA